MSYEALDHLSNTKAALNKMANLLLDDGKIINFVGGFWMSPVADHFDKFMRFLIPWRHLIFNESSLLNVRREKYRPEDPATCFENVRGGLSKCILSTYKKAIRDLSLKVLVFETNYQLRYRYNGIAYAVSRVLTKIPFVRDFLTYSAFCVLAKS